MSNQGTDLLSGPAAGMDEEEKQPEPEWEAVASSRFTHMKYDPATLRLSMRWKNGSEGHYLDVPAEAYETMRAADSLGKHLQQEIIPRFRYQPASSSS